MGFRITPVVLNILILNLLVFLADLFTGPTFSFADLFGLRYVLSERFFITQFFTHMFIHAGFQHFFFNMLGVFVFGPMVESALGAQRFMLFYLLSGLGAAVLYSGVNFYETYTMGQDVKAYVQDPTPDHFVRFVGRHQQLGAGLDPRFADQFARQPDNPEYRRESVKYVSLRYQRKMNSPMVGASGALYGVLVGALLLFPNVRLFLLFPPIPIKIKYIVALYGFSAIFGAIRSAPGDNVAHYAHLGGMLFGWLLLLYWGKKSGGFG